MPIRLIAGFGCRRSCPVDELQALLQQCLAAHGRQLDELVGLASSAHKRDEPGLQALPNAWDCRWNTWRPRHCRHSPGRPRSSR